MCSRHSYDNAEEVRTPADRRGFETKLVPMKNTHHAEMNELLIGRDLAEVEQRDQALDHQWQLKI